MPRRAHRRRVARAAAVAQPFHARTPLRAKLSRAASHAAQTIMTRFYDENTLQAAGIDVQAVVAAIDTTRPGNWTAEETNAAKQKMNEIIDRGGNVKTAASKREIEAAVNAVGNRSEHAVKRKVGELSGEITVELSAVKRQLMHQNAAKDMVIGNQNIALSQQDAELAHKDQVIVNQITALAQKDTVIAQKDTENTQLRQENTQLRTTNLGLIENAGKMMSSFQKTLEAIKDNIKRENDKCVDLTGTSGGDGGANA